MGGISPPGGKPSKRVRKDLARALQREERAWTLYTHGVPQRAIVTALAEEGLGTVQQSAVSKMIHRAESRAVADLSARVQGRKAVQAARLERIFIEAYAGWRRSTKDAQVARQKSTEGEPQAVDSDGEKIPGTGRAGRKEEALEIRPQAGDASFLRVALQALASEAKLLGLDAPSRAELSGPGSRLGTE